MKPSRKPVETRIADVRRAFGARRAVPISDSSQIIIHSHNILRLDRTRTESETASTPDNRGGRSGPAETGSSSTRAVQHTIGHLRCPACESARSRAMQRSVIDPKLDFSTAAKKWLEWHRPHISARTAGDYEQYIATLELFDLGPTPLTKIHPGHFTEYQSWRRTKPKKGRREPAHQSRAELPETDPRAIRPVAGAEAILQTAPAAQVETASGDDAREGRRSPRDRGANKNWEVAHCCLVITDNTGLGPGELRAVQIEHLRLEDKKVYAAAGDLGDKNEFRIAPCCAERTRARRI
jgi:hypothetical protein